MTQEVQTCDHKWTFRHVWGQEWCERCGAVRGGTEMILLDEHLAALRDHVRRAVESEDGWARVEVEPDDHVCPWKWHHVRELAHAGLLKWREEWKNAWVQPTDEGWELLATLPAELRTTEGRTDG